MLVFSNFPAVFVEVPVLFRSQPVIFACNFFLLTTEEDKPQLFGLRFELFKWDIFASCLGSFLPRPFRFQSHTRKQHIQLLLPPLIDSLLAFSYLSLKNSPFKELKNMILQQSVPTSVTDNLSQFKTHQLKQIICSFKLISLPQTSLTAKPQWHLFL